MPIFTEDGRKGWPMIPFSVIECSDLLGVSRQTVSTYVRRGYLRRAAGAGPARIALSEIERVTGQKLSEGSILKQLRRAVEGRQTRRNRSALSEYRTS
jgi:IS30 family transposase